MRIIIHPILILALISITPPAHSNDADRSKKIDFDGSVVEGMNKKPLDSLSHIADPNSQNRIYLYQKKDSFRSETRQTSRELELAQ